MTIIINYKNKSSKKNSENIIFFVDEKYNISGLKNHILRAEYSLISDLIKTRDLKKKILSFDLSSRKKIILVSLKNSFTSSDTENIGAEFYDLIRNFRQNEFSLNSDVITGKFINHVGYFLHGLKL